MVTVWESSGNHGPYRLLLVFGADLPAGLDLVGQFGVPHRAGGGHHRVRAGVTLRLVVGGRDHAADAVDREIEPELFTNRGQTGDHVEAGATNRIAAHA